MLPFKVIYHPQYDLDLGQHVFPSEKFRLIHDALLAEGIAEPGDFMQPEPAPTDDILRAANALGAPVDGFFGERNGHQVV